MTEVDWLVAFGLSLAAGVAAMGIGAFLLHQAVKDASDLATGLPTLPLKEDTSEARATNRRKALREVLFLLSVRSFPGWFLVIFSAGFLIWISRKLLIFFHV
jgi:hypothetical protein